MASALTRLRIRLAWAGLAFAASGAASAGQSTSPADIDVASRLDRLEALGTSDHARFVKELDTLHHDGTRFPTRESWHLRYLDAWEVMFEGRYGESETALRDIVKESDDDVLAAKASALLLTNLGNQGKYEEGYVLANRLTDSLPGITDPQARFMVLSNLSQLLNFAGQTELAIKYAKMMESATPAGESRCRPLALRAAALEGGGRATSSSPEISAALERCTADGQPVFANAMSLMRADRLRDEGHPDEVLAMMDRIEPSIRATDYYPHILSMTHERAQAYAMLGREAQARTAALAAVAMSHPGDVNEWLRGAYELLYKYEKARGHAAAALAYYEQFFVQDKGYLADKSARALAFVAARQHLLVQQLENEQLGKENSILRLQRALDAKAVEAGRLSIALLVLMLLSVVVWLVRIKRSQLRFKWLSSCDGLTGIFHHQHFMGEAERGLRVLQKRAGEGCLLSLDLDYFKQVNDTHGHVVGDAVLKHTVAICKAQLRRADILGRLGGEEFGILLMDAPSLQGSVVAERIRLAIEASPLIVDDVVVSFSASIGLACTESIGYDLQRLYRAADAALYRAKRAGRNRVVTDIDPAEPAMPRPLGMPARHGSA